MAHSAWVLTYSTQLLTSKLEVMIVLDRPQCSWWILSCHNQSERLCFWPCTVTIMVLWHVISIVCRTSNICFASCPSMHASSPLLLVALTHFPGMQTMLLWQNLSSPLKSLSISWNDFANTGQNLLANCYVSPSQMSYNNNDNRCLPLCPMTTLVS